MLCVLYAKECVHPLGVYHCELHECLFYMIKCVAVFGNETSESGFYIFRAMTIPSAFARPCLLTTFRSKQSILSWTHHSWVFSFYSIPSTNCEAQNIDFQKMTNNFYEIRNENFTPDEFKRVIFPSLFMAMHEFTKHEAILSVMEPCKGSW